MLLHSAAAAGSESNADCRRQQKRGQHRLPARHCRSAGCITNVCLKFEFCEFYHPAAHPHGLVCQAASSGMQIKLSSLARLHSLLIEKHGRCWYQRGQFFLFARAQQNRLRRERERERARIVFDFKTKATHECCLSPLFNSRLCAQGGWESKRHKRARPGVKCTANKRCSVNHAALWVSNFRKP